jgi:c-di-GMP-binding flagellar brake protein YcgR
MGLTESLEEFRNLHGGATAGILGSPDLARYRAVRDQWTELLLSAQSMGLLPGQQPRRMLRAARALQADIEFYDGPVRATTLQVSSGGFAASLAKGSQVGEDAIVVLSLPGGQLLQSSARVVSVKEHLGNTNTSFRFMSVSASEAERMELLVFDAFLEQLKNW